MIQVFALAREEELRWLSHTVVGLSIRQRWEECFWKGSSDLQQLESWRETVGVVDVFICDVTLSGSVAMLSEVKREQPSALLIPIADLTVPPVTYVRPEIQPYALLWRPLESSENQETLFRAFHSVYDSQSGESEKCFTVKTKKETWRIPYEEILAFEARDKRIVLRMKEQELNFYDTIAHLEKELGRQFFRIHKGFLINGNNLESVDWTGQMVRMRGGVVFPLSRGYRSRVKEVLDGIAATD